MQAFVRFAAAESAAVALWAFSVNRVIIHWIDSPLKTLMEAALGVVLGAIAGAWALLRPRPWRLWVPLAVIGLFSLGEVRRAALRDAYGASLYSASPSTLLTPVSTTDLAVRRFTVNQQRLGSHRFRVVHLTDVHISEKLPYSYFERVNAVVREQSADAVVLTGDYVSHVGRLGLFTRWLDDLSRSPGEKYAVLGNHDYWAGAPEDVRAALRAAHVQVLSGACGIARPAPGLTVQICGTEAPWGPELETLMPEAGADLRLTLSHTPDNVYELHELGADAVFTGHTHGGQIRILGLGAVVIPSRFGRRFDEGHFVVDGTHLFVSAGIGADAPALRVWCPPEIFVVDFVGTKPDVVGPS